MRKGIHALAVWLGFGLWAVAVQAQSDGITEQLRQRLQSDMTGEAIQVANGPLGSAVAVSRFYAQRDYRPAWLAGERPTAPAAALVGILEKADQDGLRPADYHVSYLRRALAQFPDGGSPVDLELRLTDAFMTYGSHLLSGRLSQRWGQGRYSLTPRSMDLAAVLQETLAAGSLQQTLANLASPHPEYARLRAALERYRRIARAGGWPAIDPGPKLVWGARGERVAQLQTRLRVTGDLEPGPAAPASEAVFDLALETAVKRFQRRHGLLVDGVVGANTLAALNVDAEQRVRQIELNMERWRWLPEDLGRRHILVNIPGFEMSVVEDGRPVMEVPVIVGRSKRPTPVFSAQMSYLVLSPYWNVPETIALEDKLPLLRQDPYALFREGIHVYDVRTGLGVDPGQVNWRAVGKGNFPYRLRQDPGRGNALGSIKFMFPNPWDIYLHDTSSRHLFERSRRMFSSGCVRVAKPYELAEYLLRDDPRWTRQAIEKVARGGRERSVTLRERIPVHLLYWTVRAEEDGTVQFLDDIYQRDESLARAMSSS